MEPIYLQLFPREDTSFLDRLLTELTWDARIAARSEAFVADMPLAYTYGKGRGARTYTAGPMPSIVQAVRMALMDAPVHDTRLDSSWMRPNLSN